MPRVSGAGIELEIGCSLGISLGPGLTFVEAHLTLYSASLERKNRTQHLLMPCYFLGGIFIPLYNTTVVGRSSCTSSSSARIVALYFESTGLGAGSQQAQA